MTKLHKYIIYWIRNIAFKANVIINNNTDSYKITSIIIKIYEKWMVVLIKSYAFRISSLLTARVKCFTITYY